MMPDVKKRLAEAYKALQEYVVRVFFWKGKGGSHEVS